MAQARVCIPLPTKIHLEEPPYFLHNELPRQALKCTPRDANSRINTTPSSKVLTQTECKKHIRVITAHCVEVPPGLQELLAGGITIDDVDDSYTMSTDGKYFLGKFVNTLIADVWQEKFGPKSFFRAYVRGRCAPWISNLSWSSTTWKRDGMRSLLWEKMLLRLLLETRRPRHTRLPLLISGRNGLRHTQRRLITLLKWCLQPLVSSKRSGCGVDRCT